VPTVRYVVLSWLAGLAFVLAWVVTATASATASAAGLGSRVLTAGMNGSDVRTLQLDLSRVGLETPAGGRFGPQTELNVRKFERRAHLKVTGSVDRGFVSALHGALGATSNSPSGSGGSGGSGIGAGSGSTKARTKGKTPVKGKTHVKAKGKTQTKGVAKAKTRPSKKAAKSKVAPPTIGPVATDGGSQHLGERTLRQGMNGHDVRVLQGYLTVAGFPTNVDGQFGPTTKANVIKFQQAHAMTADGVVTYPVQLALRETVAQAPVSATVGKATINSDGTASAPSGAPAVVQEAIAAANQIIDKPYLYGGGHQSWNAAGYDCSGAVSYALHGAGLLSSPEDSTGLESYGSSGPGKWITVYADSSHTFVVVAGIAFDTADYGGPNVPSGSGPRWRRDATGNLADGGDYVVRHPSGL